MTRRNNRCLNCIFYDEKTSFEFPLVHAFIMKTVPYYPCLLSSHHHGICYPTLLLYLHHPLCMQKQNIHHHLAGIKLMHAHAIYVFLYKSFCVINDRHKLTKPEIKFTKWKELGCQRIICGCDIIIKTHHIKDQHQMSRSMIK